jgi:microsomal dipeptidase-like Zn-dependent dipeptidase
MNKLPRKAFLKNVGWMAFALTNLPQLLRGGGVTPPAIPTLPDTSTWKRPETFPGALPDAVPTGIIDLHCHPSLKMYLLNKHMWRRHHPIAGPNIVHMQEDLHQLHFGFVKGMIAAHYLPEGAIERQWDTVKRLYPLLSRLLRSFTQKLEHEDATNFSQINNMIDILEEQLTRTNQLQKDIKFVIARSYPEFQQALQQPGVIPVAHAIEGAHALGRHFPISVKRQKDQKEHPENYRPMAAAGADGKGIDPAPYLRNLEALHQRGVCLMTLAHFFRNDLVNPVDGVSPDGKKIPGMAWQFTPDQDRPLSPVGRAVVQRMLDIGMIVDLTHSTPTARADIFRMNRAGNRQREKENKTPRPLVFTHTGAQQIYEYYDQGHYPFYKYYDASDSEIDQICECDGTIGVLAENFWLVGADTHLRKEFRPGQFRYGIPYIIETMKYINSKTRSRDYSNVSIGTDFDGLADAPKDLYKPSQLGDLIDALKNDPEISAEEVGRIVRQNAQRVLEYGWGNR